MRYWLILFLACAPLFAATVNVDCSAGSLGAAVASLEPNRAEDNNIIITGLCVEPVPVVINRFSNLSINGAPGATVKPAGPMDTLITLRESKVTIHNLIIDGAGAAQAVAAAAGSRLSLHLCTVKNASSTGVSAATGSAANLFGTQVTDIGNTAFRIDMSAQGFLAPQDEGGTVTPTVLQRVNLPRSGFGIVSNGGDVSINKGTLIRNFGSGLRCNGGTSWFYSAEEPSHLVENYYGIVAIGCNLMMNGPVEVSRNLLWGMILVNTTAVTQWGIGTQVIENNGTTGASSSGGILARNGSYLNLVNGRVTGNVGPGIDIEDLASALLSNMNVTGNTGYGIKVGALSTVEVGSNNTVQNNGGAGLFCVPNAYGHGDPTGISKMICPGFNQSPSPGEID
jgi:hypothetical protein